MLYEQYKLNRKPTPSLLMENLDEFESSFSELGISSFSLENYEADDIIATLAVGVARNDGEAIILSTDKSFLQLLCTNIRVFNHFEQTEITAEVVREKYGVEVDQLVSFWAMTGDASNNIKGVPGVGKKIAAGLLGDYGSLESILGDDTSEGPVAKVQANKAEALKCQQLVSLKTDVELGINLRSFRLRN